MLSTSVSDPLPVVTDAGAGTVRPVDTLHVDAVEVEMGDIAADAGRGGLCMDIGDLRRTGHVFDVDDALVRGHGLVKKTQTVARFGRWPRVPGAVVEQAFLEHAVDGLKVGAVAQELRGAIDPDLENSGSAHGHSRTGT